MATTTTEMPDRWDVFESTCALAGIHSPVGRVLAFLQLPERTQEAVWTDLATDFLSRGDDA